MRDFAFFPRRAPILVSLSLGLSHALCIRPRIKRSTRTTTPPTFQRPRALPMINQGGSLFANFARHGTWKRRRARARARSRATTSREVRWNSKNAFFYFTILPSHSITPAIDLFNEARPLFICVIDAPRASNWISHSRDNGALKAVERH